jgi:hypothetical protein
LDLNVICSPFKVANQTITNELAAPSVKIQKKWGF